MALALDVHYPAYLMVTLRLPSPASLEQNKVYRLRISNQKRWYANVDGHPAVRVYCTEKSREGAELRFHSKNLFFFCVA